MNKLKLILKILLMIILLSLVYLFLYEPQYHGDVELRTEPAIFSHRGYGDLGPDNALSSSLRAMDEGFFGIDVDGQVTADNQLVIFHDLSVDRLTSGTGKVSSLTLEELRQLDLNESFADPAWDGSYVSSFEDFVQEITPRGVLMVEMKIPGIANTGAEEEAVRIIKKYDAFDKVYLSSFNPLVLYRLEKTDPRVQTALIFLDTNWNEELRAEIKPEDFVAYPWILQQEWFRRGIRNIVKPDMLSVNVEVDLDTRHTLISRGWPIYLWTINEGEALREAIDSSPYAIITDQPHRAQSIMEAQ